VAKCWRFRRRSPPIEHIDWVGSASAMGKRRHFGNVRRFSSDSYQAAYWHGRRRHVAPQTFETKSEANAFLDAMSASLR
jgi:hypothetical protein